MSAIHDMPCFASAIQEPSNFEHAICPLRAHADSSSDGCASAPEEEAPRNFFPEQEIMNSIPNMPSNEPFTLEQQAYLRGFVAGMFSRNPSVVIAPMAQSQPLKPLTILFGSQAGTTGTLAKKVA